jgi:hypothetical protein
MRHIQETQRMFSVGICILRHRYEQQIGVSPIVAVSGIRRECRCPFCDSQLCRDWLFQGSPDVDFYHLRSGVRCSDLYERLRALDKTVVTEGFAEEFIEDSVELAKANSN